MSETRSVVTVWVAKVRNPLGNSLHQGRSTNIARRAISISRDSYNRG